MTIINALASDAGPRRAAASSQALENAPYLRASRHIGSLPAAGILLSGNLAAADSSRAARPFPTA
jgi:hypothetical protein